MNMAYTENIEKLFLEDVREKKKAGRGAFHMRGKGIRHGSNKALRTPFHFMKNKEKKKLDGEVVSYNMNSLMAYHDFEQKDFETKKMLMTNWRAMYQNNEIMDAFFDEGKGKRFNAQSFANLVNELGCPPKAKGGSKSRAYTSRVGKGKVKKEDKVEEESKQLLAEFKDLAKENLPQEAKPMLITNGLHLEYNGDYDAESISKIFTKLQLLVEGEESKFKLSISLSERT
jgi:hypothetical protein